MISTLEPPVHYAVDRTDLLFQLQLQVARRADEMRREDGAELPSFLAWLRAEREILAVPAFAVPGGSQLLENPVPVVELG